MKRQNHNEEETIEFIGDYTVAHTGSRIVDEYRGDRILGDLYVLGKPDGTGYEVTLSEIADLCTCPAGSRGRKCKHTKIIREWRMKGKP